MLYEVITVVTIPSPAEGRKRFDQAQVGIQKLKESVDSMLVISNDRLHNIYGRITSYNVCYTKLLRKFSDRIILARELSIEQVKEIVDQVEKENILGPKGKLVEIEVFGHGALCVAVSGRCSMSLFCYGTSANKGKCTQVCRRQYKITDIETGKELKIDNNS